MRIKKLELKNFRGFEDLTIDFPEGESGLAVFVGVNGSGKTSMLDAINNSLYHFTFNLFDQRNDANEEIKNRIIRTRSRGSDVRIGSSRSDVDSSVENNNVTVNIHEGVDLGGSYDYSTSTPDGNTIGTGSLTIDDGVPESVFEYRKKLKATPFTFAYYPDNRTVPSEPLLSIEDVSKLSYIDTLKNAFDIKIDFSNLFKWFRNFEDIENQKRLREDNSYRHMGLEVVRKIIPYFLEEFSNPFVNREGREELVARKDNLELSISQLSQGERIVIAMVSDIAMRLHIANPKLENILEGKGIVLIDEIEQHLHPAWQRTIIPNLRRTFPNIQFILTTHSPQVISTLHRENVFILDNFQLVQETPHTYGRDSNSILYDIFGVEKRPAEAKEEFAKLYRLMDDPDKVDETASLLQDVEAKYGYYDEEVVRARGQFQFLNEA